MIDRSGKQLVIFANFQHLDPEKNRLGKRINLENVFRNVAQQIVNNDYVHPEDLFIFEGELRTNPNWIKRQITTYERMVGKMKPHWIEFFSNPMRYFERIKYSKQVIQQLCEEGEDRYDILLTQAKASHQTALVETLENHKTRITREMKMLEVGVKTFVSEEDLIKFSREETRKLKLDWVKNFTRFIPTELQHIIAACSEKELFDNYVILHYDPDNTGTKLTKKEEELKKDPILFGVIEESRRLYYLGDWIDEYCNLTLDKLLDKLVLKEEDRDLNSHLISSEGISNVDDAS